jgi:hypothetical protein
MDSIHSELKLIIEDELFEKVNSSLPQIEEMQSLIAKIDVTLSFA